MKKLQLLQILNSADLPKKEYCLFGGVCLAIRDIRETNDIDLYVTKKVYNELKSRGWTEKYDEPYSPYLSTTISGVEFEAFIKHGSGKWVPDIKHYIEKPEIIENYPFMPLKDLYEWKASVRRSKDISDLKLIKDYWSK